MPDIINFPLFLLSTLALCITPGPDIAYVVGQSIAHGRRAGVMSAAGVALGSCCHAVACALGLTAIIAASPLLFLAVKYLGAAYLIYLGGRMLWDSLRRYAPSEAPPAADVATDRQLLLRGLITTLTNPKVLLFFIAFFPQFVPVDSPDNTGAFLMLGMAYAALAFCTDLTFAWLAGSATQAVSTNARLRSWLDRIVGITFVALGVRLALLRR